MIASSKAICFSGSSSDVPDLYRYSIFSKERSFANRSCVTSNAAKSLLSILFCVFDSYVIFFAYPCGACSRSIS